jgi:hypothetical protein
MNYDREEIYLQHKIRDAESSIERMQRDVEYKIKHSSRNYDPVDYSRLKISEVVAVIVIVLGIARMFRLI